jgi:hypothetical protein
MESDKKKDLDVLITKYLESKCTREEKEQLLGLLGSYENKMLSKEVLFSHLFEFQANQDETHPVDFEKIYDVLLSKISEGEAVNSERQKLRTG